MTPTREELFCPELWFSNMVVVDGMPRSGKSLVATTVSNMNQMEPWQLPIYVDHVVKYLEIGEFSYSGAKVALRIGLNSYAFDYAVGRGLNRRVSDWSNVSTSDPRGSLRERELEPSYEVLLNRFRTEGRIPVFVTHDHTSYAPFWFSSVPGLKFIEVIRHPASLMQSWQRRQLSDRWGTDPLEVTPCLNAGEEPIPFFARHIAADWVTMNSQERLVSTMEVVSESRRNAVENLASESRGNFRLIRIETLKSEPHFVVERLSRWIGVGYDAVSLESFFGGEGLPREGEAAAIESAIRDLEQSLPPHLLPRFHDVLSRYEEEVQSNTDVTI